MVGKVATWFMVVVMALTTGISGNPARAQSGAAEAPRGKPALQTRGTFIDQRIAEFMEKHGVPGLSMAIVQAPYIPRSAGYGRASLAHDELASTRTAWNIGPITQAFTAVAIFQLYESQKLDIRDAIEKYLPGLAAAWSKTTVLDLLQPMR
jgi:CubicO group peptidase (beta-lactamase class C family)